MFSSDDQYVQNLLSGNDITIKYKKEDLPQVNPQLYKWLATINDSSSNKKIVPQNKDIVKPKLPNEENKEAYSIGNIKKIGKAPSKRLKGHKGTLPTKHTLSQNKSNVNNNYMQKSENNSQKSSGQFVNNAPKEKDGNLTYSSNNSIKEKYEALKEKYGVIKKGEQPAVDYEVPKKISDNEYKGNSKINEFAEFVRKEFDLPINKVKRCNPNGLHRILHRIVL